MGNDLRNITPAPPNNQVTVNGHAANANQAVGEFDLVQTSGAGASVSIFYTEGNQAAASVSGPSSAITTYAPPTQSLVRVYYNNSYRYKLQTPGGYVGIRG